jgi:hypothetical protein
VACETRRSTVGADVLIFESTVPEPGVALALTSTYLGSPDSDTTISHLCTAADMAARAWARSLPAGQVTPALSPSRCLLDHLAELQTALTDLGHEAAIEAARPGDPLHSI